MQPVLELKRVSKSFGGLQAVRGVDLQIFPGDRKAIIGPNGAGKTTLFNVITGILPTTSGRVLLFGHDVTGWPSQRRTALGMARTFQITSLFPKLTVLDNVLLAVTGLRKTKFVTWRFLSSYANVYGKAHALLGQAGFLDRKGVEVRYLSHGEQRQLEIVLGRECAGFVGCQVRRRLVAGGRWIRTIGTRKIFWLPRRSPRNSPSAI
jgi:branched-chain amino acid transport system ATP-binding protein